MVRFLLQLIFVIILCLFALLLWYVFAPLSVLLMLIISGLGNADSDLLNTPVSSRKRQR